MPGWAGWQDDLRKAAHIPSTQETLSFLDAWSMAVEHRGTNNPLGAKQAEKSSTNYNSHNVQNYPTPAEGTAGTVAQLEQSAYRAILLSLQSGRPSSAHVKGDLPGEMKAWGVNYPKFLQALYEINNNPPPVGTPDRIPEGRKAFSDMQVALAKTLPTALHRSAVVRKRILHKMGQHG